MATPKDLLHVGPQLNSDGSRICVRVKENEEPQIGVVKPIADGESSYGDLIKITYRGPGSVYDVEELSSKESSGPSKVNSEEFRNGWDRIFGGTKTVGVA